MEEVATLIIFITIILVSLVVMMVIVYTKFLKKKSQMMNIQKAEQLKFQEVLAQTQIEIKEQTLTYVGQELHDDLGQKLSVAKMMNNMLLNKCDPSCKDDIDAVNQLIGECIQDIRILSKTFITGQVEFLGIEESIKNEVRRIEKLKIPKTTYFLESKNFSIPKEHALILFRIIQEALNNVLKHSRAKNLEIRMEIKSDALVFSVIDDGIGIDSDHKNGSGIMNMINRAKLLDAHLEIINREPTGTIIQITYK